MAETAGGMCCGGTCTWCCTLACWQSRQAFAQAMTPVERPFQTYLEETRRWVACMPGWAVPWLKYLSPKVSGHQWAECAGGGVADEAKVADVLGDGGQSWAGAKSLYLWGAKDLAEGHIL